MRARRLHSPSLAVAALVAAAACATIEDAPSPPPGPPPFRGVKSLVLARASPDPAGRPKDPLDALKESLDARGLATRIVDVGGRAPPELRGLERLHAHVATRIWGAAQGGRFGRPVEPLGREAAAVVQALGVDAVALYHRFDARPPPGAFPEPRAPPYGPAFPAPANPVLERRPIGALSLVDREGQSTWIEWGSQGVADDLDTPANATEAIDALVAVLTGEEEAR